MLANPGNTYVIYFTNGGLVDLDLRDQTGLYTIRWLDVMNSVWSNEFRIQAVN